MERAIFPEYLWAFSTLLFLAGIASSCSDRYWLLQKPVAFFIFGDSIFDAGNNNYINTSPRFQANYWPYGESFFNTSTGRATNGRTIPDFISDYAKLPLIPPYLQPDIHDYVYGVNFASIGAGTLVETHPGLVIDLKTQLSNFYKVEKQLRDKLGCEEANTLLSTAVYLFSVGGNDYFAPFQKNTSFFESEYIQKEYTSMVIGTLTNVIQEIYNKGGRKFGFLNLTPLGSLPYIKALKANKTDGCDKDLTEVAKLHNSALSEALQKLESQVTGFKYALHDFFTSVDERSENPSKYGFKEVNMACCGSGPYRGYTRCGSVRKPYELCENPSDFLYFDPFHPTEKAYAQIAKLFWSGKSKITGPYNLKYLFKLDNECRTSLIS
ncbi:GDSL esterase/lipase 1 isoform X1 [Morus notabilis]|uniref:GDSL esterase/lipase 1 isoform X1 n=2 Tax=Morus notabilis TaxID=981085 RepID=UPI000CED32A9|nr:GDSL esterase/lipase 1 isoform X1 [Morus notabilis]